MAVVLGLIGLIYSGLLLFLLSGVRKVRPVRTKLSPAATFSVVIPFRNESRNLPALLQSLECLNYPKTLFEILLIDDDSRDGSDGICQDHIRESGNIIKYLKKEGISGSPKKDAITTGIKAAKFDYILTTDADCVVPQGWLGEFNSTLGATGAKMIGGPVAFRVRKNGRSFLEIFQALDFLSLQTATIGGFGLGKPFLCNGANLCYLKQSFLEVGGYHGNYGIASGDDVFLLKKFRSKGWNIRFVNSSKAVVRTQAQPDVKSLIEQRLRWTSKFSSNGSSFFMVTAVVVLLMNLALIIAFTALILGFPMSYPILLLFTMKFLVDLIFILPAAELMSQKKLLKQFWWCSLLYPFFSSFVGLGSRFLSYDWKGRTFKE